MKKKRIFVTSQYLITDPPTKNVVHDLFKNGYEVVYAEQSPRLKKELLPTGVTGINIRLFTRLPFHSLRRLVNSFLYRWKINQLIREHKPDVVIGVMFQPITAIRLIKGPLFIAAILDIPVIDNCGKYDYFVINRAFKNLVGWHLVWASDEYKAGLIKEMCSLSNEPAVCYNCPPLNYFVGYEKAACRTWIVDKLNEQGLIADNDSMIILRAGAIGEYCGIEETIQALKELPENVLFIAIGRPASEYVSKVRSLVNTLQLNSRFFLFLHPSDDEWKKYLLGSDIGHLIHTIPPDNNNAAKIYSLNSSLSNNRVYQYMAAGLPIISYDDERLFNLYKKVKCFSVVSLQSIEASLKNEISILNDNLEERKRLGEEAKKAFLNNYNWELQFKNILNKIAH